MLGSNLLPGSKGYGQARIFRAQGGCFSFCSKLSLGGEVRSGSMTQTAGGEAALAVGTRGCPLARWVN